MTRSETFSFKVSPEEKQGIDRAAAAAGERPGALVYRWVRERLAEPAPTAPPSGTEPTTVEVVDREFIARATALVIAALSDSLDEAAALEVAQKALLGPEGGANPC
jgi:uncharacterized protein (DUF1778 family)